MLGNSQQHSSKCRNTTICFQTPHCHRIQDKQELEHLLANLEFFKCFLTKTDHIAGKMILELRVPWPSMMFELHMVQV